jgi:hypothetical protein
LARRILVAAYAAFLGATLAQLVPCKHTCGADECCVCLAGCSQTAAIEASNHSPSHGDGFCLACVAAASGIDLARCPSGEIPTASAGEVGLVQTTHPAQRLLASANPRAPPVTLL